MTRTVVATANVLGALSDADASAALAAVVDHGPDLVALQEWQRRRAHLLRPFDDYHWFSPRFGGCAVGARRSRFTPVRRGTGMLSRPGRGDRDGRFLGLEPPRFASLTVHRDREAGGTVALVDYHLVSQVQARGRYREDRPRLVARHQRERDALLRLVADTIAAGHTTYACGDSNFHGLRIPGLVSAWEGRPDVGGTLGPTRQIDDVHAPAAPLDVVLVATASDHLAVVASFE